MQILFAMQIDLMIGVTSGVTAQREEASWWSLGMVLGILAYFLYFGIFVITLIFVI